MKSKDHAEATKRFLEAMMDVIHRSKLKGGKVNSAKAFAVSIGQLPQNFSKYTTKSKQMVSAPIIIAACKLYRLNPTWIMLGEGGMYLSSDLEAKTGDLEERMKRIEKLLDRR